MPTSYGYIILLLYNYIILNSQGMKNCKNTESLLRSILAIYTSDGSLFDMVTAVVFLFLCEIPKCVQA